VIASGGAITGEHGIGLAKKRWWPQAVSEGIANCTIAPSKRARSARHFESGKFV
jgi:FAD/FMN-containing dehydrogenase